MRQRYEFYLKSSLEGEIYCQIWKSSLESSVGNILLTHGLSEHSDCYDKFSQHLNSWGLNVLGWDLIGHGRSSGKRGFVKDFDHFLIHQKIVIEWALKEGLFYLDHLENDKQKDKEKKKPFFLFSHSLGALITIKNLLVNTHLKPDGLLLSSPCLGLSFSPPKFTVWFSKLVHPFFPRLTLRNQAIYENLTRDQEIIKSYSLDPLRHERISFPLYFGLLKSLDFVKSRACELNLPILFQVSKKDKITNSKEALVFYHKVSSSLKRFLDYPDSRHEIYNDLDRGEAFSDLKGFLSQFFKFKEKK